MSARPKPLACAVETRRRHLFGNPYWNGLDFVEVSDDQLSLCVHFFGPVPDGVSEDNVLIKGGRRIRGIRAIDVHIERSGDPEVDDCLHITLDKRGDFSIYLLCLVEAAPPPGGGTGTGGGGWADDDGAGGRLPLHGLDPRYSCAEFSFKTACPSDLDCAAEAECPPAVFQAPEINYLAKDYESFRQLLLDRLAVTMPDWTERHIPDIGITLVELLAYAGDYLSYFQDAVATEAYLDTARLRISVRRHARLVDYHMHEGCNARAWVCVSTKTDLDPLPASDIYFITGYPDIPVSSGRVVKATDLETVPQNLYEVFEPFGTTAGQTLEFRAAHSEIRLYTWGDEECCLPAGATRATLLDEAPGKGPAGVPARRASASSVPGALGGSTTPDAPRPAGVLRLKEGDVLIFEEVKGPTTGNAADADPARRHAVRLTRVRPGMDRLFGRPIVEVEWAQADALPFALCLSSRLPAPDCSLIENVSVARGNVVLVEHGRLVTQTCGPVDSVSTVSACACEGSIVDEITVPAIFRPVLTPGPVSYAESVPRPAAASATLSQDPRLALPEISLTEYTDTDTDTPTGPTWRPVPDLLQSQSEDPVFVTEIDDDGTAHLRFGDDDLGKQPAAGTRFLARYRMGNGPAGDVGRDTICYIVKREGTLSADAIEPRNPLPAVGGTAPEPIDEVKLLAPTAFRGRRERAITAADYAELAQRDPWLQGAAAELRWTGSWYEARVAVDPAHSERASPRLIGAIERLLHHYRRMGHDLDVVAASYVPIALALDVCVLPHATNGGVKAELLRVLGNRKLPDGRLGFFHPDSLTFGDGVWVSKLVAAAKSVDGVDAVRVTTLRRLDGPGTGAPAAGVLPLGPMEIPQLDNDPNFPEHGSLTLNVVGGR